MLAVLRKPFEFRLVRYGLVGLTATAIHVVAASVFVRAVEQSLLLANLFGFCWAFLFSYIAQSRLVFASHLSIEKSIRYLMIQLASLLTASFLAGQVAYINIYVKVLLTAVLLPLITFFVHKTWTFRERNTDSVIIMNNKTVLYVSGLIMFTVLVRFYGMWTFPLHDPSEARYAEIPRLILETGQWIMPPFNYGQPFWGKPPLTFWLTALSFRLFGLHEFSARLPVFIVAGLLLVLVYRFARCILDEYRARLSIMALVTTPVFFIASGAVLTDMPLTLCVSLSMIAFWLALHSENSLHGRLWGYAFFVGLGVGLLVKGPIVGVLALLPVLAWVTAFRRSMQAWLKIPWVTGTGLMLLIAAPWYISAEVTSPGFIDYFLVGEHFMRFVDSGWQGDLYGDAHSAFRGKIWLLWLLVCLPWSLLFIFTVARTLWTRIRLGRWPEACTSPLFLYLCSWTLTPMVFFTLSRNILYTYVLPGTPALAILSAWLMYDSPQHEYPPFKRLLLAGLITPLLGLVFFTMDPESFSSEKNQQELVRLYQTERLSEQSGLYYLYQRLYSVDFYTQGRAELLNFDSSQLTAIINNGREDFIIMRQDHIKAFDPVIMEELETVGQYRKYLLFRDKEQ